MIDKILQRKIDASLHLLDSAAKQTKGKVIELSYSGGKDSDVILELAKMAGVCVRPIYKSTTIDPPGTIAHVLSKNVEIVRPKYSFAQIIQRKGFPNRLRRFCCAILKEYKIEDFAIQGIRRCESVKRMARYHEPQICRLYENSKKQCVSIFLPILEWSNEDVRKFIEARNIQCHKLYYDEAGNFCVEKRLGCMACPLQGDNGLHDFKANPKLVKFWLRNGEIWWNHHELKKTKEIFENHYDVFVRNVFFQNRQSFEIATNGMFGKIDSKQFLEDYFKIKL